MQLETVRALRQALLDNAAGHPLAQVHRNNLFTVLDECEALLTMIVPDEPTSEVLVASEPEAPAVPRKIRTKK